ncbi:MAG TPA: CYTH and CHAD domain-containing protein [Streptosporangiaceae bacterium]|nr:CYTH and CHAD domain-containing protein [Streptosporangiaceae bacterium]
MKAGVTLRRRRGGRDAGWHLKLPAAGASRREIQLPLTDGAVPGELSDLVQAHARGSPLRLVAQIRTSRRVLALLGESGDSLAEVADDEVSAWTLGDSAAITQWREVEIELTGGDEELLREAGRELRLKGLQPAAGAAKLARAFGVSPQHHDGTQVDPCAAASDVVLAYLRVQFRELTALDPLVRRDEPDSVHQMRTTIRRMRSTLRAFRGVLRREDTEHLQEELKWLGGQLGGARDAEVLAARLAEGIRQTPVEQVIGPVRASAAEHFAAESRAAREEVLTTLGSRRYFSLLDDLDRLLADPPTTPVAGRPARDVLPADVARAYRRTARRMRHVSRVPTGQARDVALHETRKAAKQARYAGELVTPVIGKPAKRFTKRMKKVQSVLGEHQDAVIAQRVDRDLGMRAQLLGESAFTYGLLHERETEHAHELQARAARAWQRASRRKATRWLP